MSNTSMKLIVGLGNPGEKYEATRHNLGFVILDHFLKNLEPVDGKDFREEKKFKSDIVEFEWEEEGRVILAKPRTYMNNSGMAVSLLSSFYKFDPADIWVVYDELDLPLGTMKIRMGGSAAGHKGVESIIEALGNDKFWRFRMGIGVSRQHDEMAKHNMRGVDDFVLGEFDHGEVGKVKDIIKRGTKALKLALEDSIEAAMNQYNSK
jgi:peptidyl-tRNA hydrolase, PTH1 family